MITCKPPTFNSRAITIRITSQRTVRFLRHVQFNPSRFNSCVAFSFKRGNCLANRNVHKAHKKLRVVADFDGDYSEERGGGGEREVHCEVEVISWRERRIKGVISVNTDIKSVWSALTDYERLADFVPNLVSSSTIPCPHPGRIWLEQRGLQRALYWHIEARVVLDLQEVTTSANHHELHFSMVDGDFKKYEGKWSLKSVTRSTMTRLTYEVNVIPRYNFPAIFLERIIKSDLPVNLRAMACQAERNFEGNQKMPTDVLTLPDGDSGGALHDKDKLLSGNPIETYAYSNFGPMPQSPNELKSNWGIFGKFCQLGRPCMVDEVHLRRFDGLLENGGVHRFVIASITVKAPVPAVWNVLTAYDSLPEIVPNLAISTILSRENNKVRILQEGCKGLLYMVLHARVVLDLCEHLEREISFEQVEGDFDSFKGKWLLEQLGSHHTLLKYIVESKMRRGTFFSEAIMEEVIYKDLPSNLCAIRDYIEEREAMNSLETCYNKEYPETHCLSGIDSGVDSDEAEEDVFDINDPVSSTKRPRVPGLQRDIDVLKSELLKFISDHGQEGFMPMRKQLRRHGRVDIEKAITLMGGFRKIASLMSLSLAYKHRKPKGYWDNLENLQEEISRFQSSWGMDPLYMPSRKSFERAGRFDIARALEKWGGLREVSRLLSLKVRHPKRRARANISKDKKVEHALYTSVDNKVNIQSKPCVSEEAQKWLKQMNDLDINWVE